MYFKNVLILLLISFIMISPKVNSQEINLFVTQGLLLDILDPNESISKNIKNLEKIISNVVGRAVKRLPVIP